jgi:hypothetical protein
MNVQESLNNIEAKKQVLRENKNTHAKTETDLVCAVVRHCHEHNCPAVIFNLRDYLADWGTKDGKKAFIALNKLTTGAVLNKEKNPSINKERQETTATTFEATLSEMCELGLSDWFNSQSASAKADKTPEQKAKAKLDSAEKTLEKLAQDDTPEGIEAKAMLEYRNAYRAAAKYNAQQAQDMHNKTIGSLTSAMLASINQLKAA